MNRSSVRNPAPPAGTRREARTRSVLAALFAIATLAPAAFAADPPLAITNARIVTVSGSTIESGTVVIADGKIAAVGTNAAVPAGARVIDGRGKTVYPGLFDALTTLGLTEIGQGAPGTVDTAEMGDNNAHAKAWVALHPDSELIPVARAFGITTALSAPTGGLIAGQSAVIRTHGDTPAALTVKGPAALHMRYPTGAPVFDITQLFQEQEPRTFEQRVTERRRNQERELTRLKNLVEEARAYGEGFAAGVPTKVDLPMEGLALAAMGKIPVVMRASSENDIRGAIRFAAENRLKLIVADAAEAWRCAEDLRKADVPVLIQVEALPSRDADAYDAAYANAAALHRAGVRFAIVTNDASNSRNLPFEAAMAYAFGLPKDAAIRAITLSPAEIFGLSSQLGSIDVGKSATLIVATGEILDHRTNVTHVIVDGKETSLDNKHLRLYNRYRVRP